VGLNPISELRVITQGAAGTSDEGAMTMSNKSQFASIDDEALVTVAGGAARVAATSKSSDLDGKLQLMLSQIGDGIKEAAQPQQDSMMPMMMMMMGGGGGAASAPAAPPPPPPSVIKVNVRR
jgi:hypothetical protein